MRKSEALEWAELIAPYIKEHDAGTADPERAHEIVMTLCECISREAELGGWFEEFNEALFGEQAGERDAFLHVPLRRGWNR